MCNPFYQWVRLLTERADAAQAVKWNVFSFDENFLSFFNWISVVLLIKLWTEPTNINITIIEKTLNTGQCDSLYVLGEGITDAGWNFPGIEVTCDTDVLTVKARLQSGHFRFFTTVGDWNSGQDYTFFENDGYTIDSRLENAPAGDNFNFIGSL